MGSFANTLFTLMLGWLQGIVSAVWSAFTTENGQSFFTWIGRHWITIAVILCLTGLAADLCVYLFRWKPFRVWKSFLFRNSTRGEEPGETEENWAPEIRQARVRDSGTEADPVPVNAVNRVEEPDFSAWESEEDDPQESPAAAEPPLITNAGYTVPADSPYRRPARQQAGEPETAEKPQPQREPAFAFRKEGPVTVNGRKRRRISVNELFANPEEELLEFDAPQNVIDRKKAYLEPVYPRGWKNSEDQKT